MAAHQRGIVFLLLCAFIAICVESHSLTDSQSIEIDKINEAMKRTTKILDKTVEGLEYLRNENSELKRKLDQTQQTLSRLLLMLVDNPKYGQDAGDLTENGNVIRREVISTDRNVDFGDLLSKLSPSALQSLRGQDGKDGATGTQGPPGAPGKDGAQGLQGTPGKDAKSAGAVYTRWGRTTCEESSDLIYAGYAAGSYFATSGGGVNYQCLPLNPEYNRYGDTGHGSYSASITGVEYQTGNGIFRSHPLDSNAPCARCHTRDRSAVMMMPAKRSCPATWTIEYEGYLMTAHNDEHTSTYECVDANPEVISGTKANLHGATLYFVKPDCDREGNLHICPPYNAGRELTCVVCSK